MARLRPALRYRWLMMDASMQFVWFWVNPFRSRPNGNIPRPKQLESGDVLFGPAHRPGRACLKVRLAKSPTGLKVRITVATALRPDVRQRLCPAVARIAAS